MVSSNVVFFGSVLAPHRDVQPRKIFERLKSHEDSFDFDDVWTKTIAAAQTFFSKIFTPPKFRVAEFFRGNGNRQLAKMSVGRRPNQVGHGRRPYMR